MHLVHPGLSTTRVSKEKKKLTPKQEKAQAEHNAWLKKQGLHLDQLAARATRPSKLTKTVSADKSGPQCNNGFAQGGYKTSIFDSEWNHAYDDHPLMAEREAEALKKAEALKGQLMPLYNKGPVMVKTKGLDQKDFGKRR